MTDSKGALERGIDILFLLGSGEAQTAESIAQRLAVPKSTVYRVLKVLRGRGLVFQLLGEREFRLGFVVLRWADALRERRDLVALARPLLAELAHITGETASFTLINGDNAVTVDVVEAPAPVRVAPDQGRVLALSCGAASKAILAFLPEERWQAALVEQPLAPGTIVAWEALRADLLDTRGRGYAQSVEEVYEGAAAVAVPILSGGSPLGAIAVSGPTHRFTSEKKETAVNALLEGAARLNALMGSSVHPTRRLGRRKTLHAG